MVRTSNYTANGVTVEAFGILSKPKTFNQIIKIQMELFRGFYVYLLKEHKGEDG